MPPTPEMTWPVRVGMIVFILFMVLAIVLYHLWLDRRLEREGRRRPVERGAEPAAAGRPDRRRA
jgi:membrane protein implicated in regulation of membrane protease activity